MKIIGVALSQRSSMTSSNRNISGFSMDGLKSAGYYGFSKNQTHHSKSLLSYAVHPVYNPTYNECNPWNRHKLIQLTYTVAPLFFYFTYSMQEKNRQKNIIQRNTTQKADTFVYASASTRKITPHNVIKTLKKILLIYPATYNLISLSVGFHSPVV